MAEADQAQQIQDLLDRQIAEICEKLNNLRKREKEINDTAGTEVDIVEKDVLSRRIRFEKRELRQQLSEKTVEKAILQNNVEEEDADDDEDTDEEAEDIIAQPGANDALVLPDNRQGEYNRLENMMTRVKNDIVRRKGMVENLLKEDQDLLTEGEKSMVNVKVKSQIRSITEQVNLYKSYNKDILRICSYLEVEGFANALSEVLDLANDVMCTHEASIDKQKRINDSTGLSAIKNLSIEKYEPIGEERFIRYTAFMSEFKEYVLSKPLKTVVKLNYLKSCLLGEAYDLIKHYTHGSQLTDALAQLEQSYNKAEFIVAEVYRNLKGLPICTTFNQIKACKDQVQTLKVSLATLKTLGFEQEVLSDSSIQNTFILVELEGKIPIEAYTAWVTEKENIKKNSGSPNLESFVKFYTKMVEQQADAQYIRKQLEDVHIAQKHGKPKEKLPGNSNKPKTKETASLFGTSVEENGKKKNNWKGKNKPYCIFCEQSGHASTFCRTMKYDMSYKMNQAKKHGVCKVCLKVTNHKEPNCDGKYKTCLVCKEPHNTNLHARKDSFPAFQKLKEKQQ